MGHFPAEMGWKLKNYDLFCLINCTIAGKQGYAGTEIQKLLQPHD